MKILLTGRNGQVGWELERALVSIGEVAAFDRQTLDLAKPEQIVSYVREIRPDVIVNAAAYTNVDVAEKESELAMAINGTAPGILGEEAKRIGALVIHYSTDYVFDGTASVPYTEEDAPNPLGVYGKTKLAGEKAIEDSDCRHIILRTAWVYANRGKNFLRTMLRLAKDRPELRVVDDQYGAPTWARDIARASVKVLEHSSEPEGIFHLTAAGQTTWHGFARKIVDLSGVHTPVIPIKSTEYPAVAVRPAYSLLSNVKLRNSFGVFLADWSIALRSCLADPEK